jgi:type VI secretion system protein VasD
MSRHLLRACILSGFAWLVASAVAAAEPAPSATATTVELTVVGGPELNPNAQGRALGASQAFEAADFATLFEHPGDALKRDMLAVEELVLRPGDIQERSRTLKGEVRALGVAAAFRSLDGAVWRLTVPVQAGQPNFLLIHLNQNRIRVETIDAK